MGNAVFKQRCFQSTPVPTYVPPPPLRSQPFSRLRTMKDSAERPKAIAATPPFVSVFFDDQPDDPVAWVEPEIASPRWFQVSNRLQKVGNSGASKGSKCKIYIYIYPKPPPRRSSEYDGDHVYHLSTPRNSQRWHLSTLELRAPPTVKPSQMVKCLSRTDDLPCDGRGMDPEKQFSSIAVRNCTMFCFGCGCLMKYQLDPTGCQCMGVDETAHQASLQHG